MYTLVCIHENMLLFAAVYQLIIGGSIPDVKASIHFKPIFINPRRACAARVTVVVVSVCVFVKSHLTSGASALREDAATHSAGNEGQNICCVFSETASFQSYGTSCIVGLPCSRPFCLGGIRACASKCRLTVGRSLVTCAFQMSEPSSLHAHDCSPVLAFGSYGVYGPGV